MLDEPSHYGVFWPRTDFANTLAGRVDARATEVLQGIVEVRADAAREPQLSSEHKGTVRLNRAAMPSPTARLHPFKTREVIEEHEQL